MYTVCQRGLVNSYSYILWLYNKNWTRLLGHSVPSCTWATTSPGPRSQAWNNVLCPRSWGSDCCMLIKMFVFWLLKYFHWTSLFFSSFSFPPQLYNLTTFKSFEEYIFYVNHLHKKETKIMFKLWKTSFKLYSFECLWRIEILTK